MTNTDSDGKRRWRAPGDPTSSGDGRSMAKKQKVHKKKLGKSSREWVERQLNDPYVRRAREHGYRARAAFKLAEIDDRFSLIRPRSGLVDLGCAPGGWIQVALERGVEKIIGVDLLEVDPLRGADILQGDFTDPAIIQALADRLVARPGLVLSDMAADTTGHKQTDHVRTVALAEAAATFAVEHLEKGGAFVSKVFQGGAQGQLLALLKANFASVRHWKPPASRPESPETFVIAQGFHRAAEVKTAEIDPTDG